MEWEYWVLPPVSRVNVIRRVMSCFPEHAEKHWFGGVAADDGNRNRYSSWYGGSCVGGGGWIQSLVPWRVGTVHWS